MPIAAASAVVRSAATGRTASCATPCVRAPAAASSAFAVAGTSRMIPSLAGTTLGRLPLPSAKPASTGSRSTVLRSRSKYVSAPGPPIAMRGAPPLGSGGGGVRRGDLDGIQPDGQRDGAEAVERGERAHDRPARCLLVEPSAAPPGHGDDPEPLQAEPGLDVVPVDRGCELRELVVERASVRGHGRSHLRAEEAGGGALEAAHGAEGLSPP